MKAVFFCLSKAGCWYTLLYFLMDETRYEPDGSADDGIIGL